MYKKGVSAIVATVLVLLLTVGLIAIVTIVIRNLTTSTTTKVQLDTLCSQTDLEITRAVYWDDNDNDKLNVTIRRGTGGDEVKDIKVLVDGAAQELDEAVSLAKLETKTVTIDVNGKPSKIEVAPYVSSGDVAGECNVIASTTTIEDLTS